jgi:histone-lysine N-methyltransferase SETMAR
VSSHWVILYNTCLGDEKWIYFRNPNKNNQWLLPGETGTPVVQQSRYDRKVMISVWWNCDGVVHWEFVPGGRAVNSELYIEQLERLHEALSVRYPDMADNNEFLLQQDNAPAHKSRATQQAIRELDFDVLPHPPYSPDLAPTDYHLFRSMAHFLKGRSFNTVDEVEIAVQEFFDSKPGEWYRHGIEQLADRWQNVIDNGGLYFA